MAIEKLMEEPLNIKELLEKDSYIIPIYQRNYAWEKPEIEQLVNDISNAIENGLSQYFIGTLVVYQKEKGFEIIDGQQRHTTLSLIHASIQNRFNSEIKLNKANLIYEARKESKGFFDTIYQDFDKALEENNTFTFAINQIILPQLNRLKETGKLDKWIEYFYNSILFFRVEVPADTDLHHYFETMNNRGEQLEETEVLKAKFMSSFTKDNSHNTEKSDRFSAIWDKCADMFAYYKKENTIKTELYSQIEKISNLLSITKNIINNDPEEYQKLLNKPIDKTQSRSEVKYNSIINFPNFLLIALKLANKVTSLNEKNLLKDFGYFNENLVVGSEYFINHLEKCRENFDCYFVKRSFEVDTPYWVLLNECKNTFTKDESFEDENNVSGKEIQDKLIKIQSMLQSIYFSNTNKEWLYIGLKSVFETSEQGETDISKIGNNLFLCLKDYSYEKFYNEICLENSLPKKKGVEIPRIVFFFTDYLLWELYYDRIRGEVNLNIEGQTNNELLEKISKNKDYFNRFNFKQHSSIEHLYPQNPDNKIYITDSALNSFGNLCLISRSSNSRYSNLEPSAKKDHSKNSNLNESLKQVIMFQILEDDKGWRTEQIHKHEKEIQTLISSYITN